MGPNGKDNSSSNNQAADDSRNDMPTPLDSSNPEPRTPVAQQPPSQPPSAPATSSPQTPPAAPPPSPTPSHSTAAPPSPPMWPHRQHMWQAKDRLIGQVTCLIQRVCRNPPGILKNTGDVYVCSKCGRSACRRCKERDSKFPKTCNKPDGEMNPSQAKDNNGQGDKGPDDNGKDGKKGGNKKNEKGSGGHRQRSWTM